MLCFLFYCVSWKGFSASSDDHMQKGWNNLLIDEDSLATLDFQAAYQSAQKENNAVNAATAKLNLGICSYGLSYYLGMNYALEAMDLFKKLAAENPNAAEIGRAKCLQLISTIKSRQGNFRESISLSLEAKKAFPDQNDTSSYLGLIYNSLGLSYHKLGMNDSAMHYHQLALKERLLTKNNMYLPGSYIAVGELEMESGHNAKSKSYFQRALVIADSTGNKQAKVSALLALSKWELALNPNSAEQLANQAKTIATALSDKSFLLRSLQLLLQIKQEQNQLNQALQLSKDISELQEKLAEWEKLSITKGLEIQFRVAEQERKLKLLQTENHIHRLNNYLLLLGIILILIVAVLVILFLRKINKRNREILTTKESLLLAIEEQKKLREQQLQNEIEFKESQLSAISLHMVQKNELLQELHDQLAQAQHGSKENEWSKIINRGLSQEKDWSDFNSHFESLNKNFYSRLKLAYPEISPNDLKICALIKLNLSIKEMAVILAISPDSVKTARYRLRKKLQLNTEDNLTDFILNLK